MRHKVIIAAVLGAVGATANCSFAEAKADATSQIANERTTKQLIAELREMNDSHWDYQYQGGRETGPDKASRLVNLGFAAVPLLVKALENDSPTEAKFFDASTQQEFPMTVGDFADRILCVISATPFDGVDRPLLSRLCKADRDKVIEQHLAWYESVKDKDELEYLLANLPQGKGDPATQIIRAIHCDPNMSLEAASIALSHAKDAMEREELAELLALIPSSVPTTVLAEQFRRSPAWEVRVCAAELLFNRGDTDAENIVINRWKTLLTDDEENRVLEATALTRVLVSFTRPQVYSVVYENFQDLPRVVRLAALQEITTSDHLDKLQRGDPSSQLAALRKAEIVALQSCLNDLEEYPRRKDLSYRCWSETWQGIGVLGTRRACDRAAFGLNQLAPDEFRFDVTAPLSIRDEQLLAIGRKDPGADTHRRPSVDAVSNPTSSDEFNGLLARFRDAEEEEAAAIVNQIESLGSDAVPKLRSMINEFLANSQKHEQLKSAARRLQTVVQRIVIPEQSAAVDESTRRKLQAFLNRSLNSRELAVFIAEQYGPMDNGQPGISAFYIDVYRSPQAGIEIVYRQFEKDQLVLYLAQNKQLDCCKGGGLLLCESVVPSGEWRRWSTHLFVEDTLVNDLDSILEVPVGGLGELRVFAANLKSF